MCGGEREKRGKDVCEGGGRGKDMCGGVRMEEGDREGIYKYVCIEREGVRECEREKWGNGG